MGGAASGGGAGAGAGVKVLKWQALHGSLAKRLVVRILAFGIVISMLVFMQLVCDVNPSENVFSGVDDCDSDVGLFGMDSLLGRVLKPVTPIGLPHLRYGVCEGNANLTVNVVRELMSKELLRNDVNALCIGRGSAEAEIVLRELGFGNVDVIRKHPFLSLKQKQVVCELDFDDNSFGFVITRDLNKVSVPALLVNEMERVLKPGGIAAVVIGIEGSSHDSLIRSATSVSSFLKSSDVVHVVSLGTLTLVAFKKKTNKLGSFNEYHLPKNCPSINRNKPLINAMEPLVEKNSRDNDKRIAYLPSFIDAPKGKLVYIDMGVKKAANLSGTNWFLPSYPLDSKSFRVYIVDHDALVLSSHVKSPGVTFIYHPALADDTSGKEKTNNISDEESLMGDEEFDFFIWFKETVDFADFVVLKMNTGKPEMKFLSELFESGIICYVDELFLHCPESDEGCINVIKSLRNVGVFAHQWSAN